MTTVELTGHIDENGRLELDQPTDLPPGEVRVTIETIGSAEEEADEARWMASFDASQEMLIRMADDALKAHKEGHTVDLDPDELERDDDQ